MKRCNPTGLLKIGRAVAFGAVLAATCSALVPGRVLAQGWPSYAHDPTHSCLAVGGSQTPQKIRWSTPVDLNNGNTGGPIYIHYGSPVITRTNTVIVPVKTTTSGNFRVEAHSGANGLTLWKETTDYTLPPHSWTPLMGITLTPSDHFLAYPGAGGTIFVRSVPGSVSGVTERYAFFNHLENGLLGNYYSMNPAAFNAAIQVCTPISSDIHGNLYFGYLSSGVALPGYPQGIPSGLAKVSNTGVGSFVPASGLVADPSINKIAYNCAPAFSLDGKTLYVAANNGSTGRGYLCAVDATTLAPKSSVLLLDPSYPSNHPQPAIVADDGSATPTVGPDGDVYYGVLAANGSGNHFRGYLLHFNGVLSTSKIPSAFGWDDTASIVPASAVPSYTGSSTYLLLTKYNNYADDGAGDGMNRLAVLDPNTAMVDPISGISAMKPVITVLGVTPDPNLPGVREWCINSAAIDAVNKCAVVNSEDGHVYRWDFVHNRLSAGLYLAPSTSEAYTPTVIGPDGAIYAINDSVLYCCIAK